MLDNKVRAVLARYEEREAAEQQLMAKGPAAVDRNELLLPVGAEVGQLLHTLILTSKARRILEVGTSYGYSTLYLADAARRTDGKIITFEAEDYKQAVAREAIAEAGLADVVEWRCGDATLLLKEEPVGVDFALIDIWKELYIPCFEAIYPKLSDGALVVADNMLFPEIHRRDATAYQQVVRAKAGISSVLMPIGQGVELSCYRREGAWSA